jgi:hypothetical protein
VIRVTAHETSECDLASERAAGVLRQMAWQMARGLAIRCELGQVDELLRTRMYVQDGEMGAGRKAQVGLAD